MTTALRAQKAQPQHVKAAVESMATLNARAAEAARRVGVHACTDVTGFGFLGHLQEMLGEDGVGARIRLSAIPLLPGIRDLLAGGAHSGGARRNLAFVQRGLQVESGVSDEEVMVLCDPQTSGGLLFAVEGSRSATLIRELEAENVATVAEVGEVLGSAKRHIQIVP